jgi:hypothetical protein
MAVKGNVLYVDNAVDLVALDITNLNDIRVLKRVRDVFTANNISPDGVEFYPNNNNLIVGWKKRK